MNVTEFLEKWGRSVFEKPLSRAAVSESPPELAEIRLAILDEVRRHCYRAGARQVFRSTWCRFRCEVSKRSAPSSSGAISSGSIWSTRRWAGCEWKTRGFRKRCAWR